MANDLSGLEIILRETLRQIGPATFADVSQDVCQRVRMGFDACETDKSKHWDAWQHLLHAGLIADCGTDSGIFEWRPRVVVADGPGRGRQMTMFVDGD